MLASERDKAEGNDLRAHFDVLVSMPSASMNVALFAMFYEDRSDLSLQVHMLRSLKGIDSSSMQPLLEAGTRPEAVVLLELAIPHEIV